MHNSQKYGLCTRCMTPLHEVDGYDMDAVLRGELRRLKRLECPECMHEALGRFLDILTADDPQMREMFALLDQGMSPDELPLPYHGADDAELSRLFQFLDSEPDAADQSTD